MPKLLNLSHAPNTFPYIDFPKRKLNTNHRPYPDGVNVVLLSLQFYYSEWHQCTTNDNPNEPQIIKRARNRCICVKSFKLIAENDLLRNATLRHGSVTTFEWLGSIHKFCMKLVRHALNSTVSDPNIGCAHKREIFHFLI